MNLIKKSLLHEIKKKPFFSVITVVKNDEKNISKTIKSIINQSYKNFEYLIIDGKSSDRTIEKILKFKKKINYLSSSRDKGIYFAMNKGAKLSVGEVIIYVNSGDKLSREALKIIKKKFNQNQDYNFVFGTVKRNYTKDTVIKSGFNIKRLKYNFDFATSHSTGFYLKRKIFLKNGLFNTKFKYSADYDLYYRLIINKKIMGGYTSKSKVIGEMSKGGFSSRISFIEHLIEETKIRIHNKQNIFIILLIFFNALLKKTIQTMRIF